MKYDVFISYARADYKDKDNKPIPGNVISKITNAFKKNGITFWIDEDGIYTGDNFPSTIADAINDASVFVFVSSENSNASMWTQGEISTARDYKKPIFPIKCDQSPYARSIIIYLNMLNYSDYHKDGDFAIEQLVNSIKEELSSQQQNAGTENINDGNIIDSLSEINRQIVDVSHIALSQMIEANVRTEQGFNTINDSINNLAERQSERDNQTAEIVIKCFDGIQKQIVESNN